MKSEIVCLDAIIWREETVGVKKSFLALALLRMFSVIIFPMKKNVIGILAHVDAGKTTLSEALLFTSGAIREAGRVDNKDAFLDTDAQEKQRGITIYTKSARLNYGDRELVLIDTPGHVDFSAEMERALSVLDTAILLISATDGIQAHTKTLWKLLRRHRIPTFIFVNKIDLFGFDKDNLLASLKKELSEGIVDFEKEGCESFYEDIATSSEDLLNRFLENGILDENDIKKQISERNIFPCFFGAALKLKGVDSFLASLTKYMPDAVYGNEFGALVYKITRDEKTGVRLTHLKITGGQLPVKGVLGEEKVNELRLYSGEKYETVREVMAGDIVSIPGLTLSKPGMIYGKAVSGLTPTLEPVLVYSLIYPRTTDITEMHRIMKELEEEEPGLKVEYSEALREIHVCLMGEVQTEILTEKIKNRYGLDISFGQGKIAYKETIVDVVEGVGHFEPLRHYAEVHLKIEPMERGSGLSFDSDVSVDDLALNWQRLVLTHLKEREHRGVLTGSLITDVKITLVAGKAHIKHTEGGDFRQATYRAVRQGLMQAESILLEPYYDFTLEIPNNMVGRAMTDLDRMYCTSNVSESAEGMSVLCGRGPVATLNGYAKDVLAYTKGTGHISLAVSGYDACHNTDEVLSKIGYDPESDIRNTADSVFCSQGAGTVIPWYEVPNYMHLPFTVYENDCSEEVEVINHGTHKETEWFVTTEEIDSIIQKTAHANQKKQQTAYKGKSAALRERQRIAPKREEVTTVYKGTALKDKFMLIDGYNVVHAWPELKNIAEADINGAAQRLIDIVSNYQGSTGLNTILVFDAYKVKGHQREEVDYHNVHVVYTKTAETADHYIERYAHENGKKYDITVVTSDGVEQVIIRGAGCRLMSSMEFLAEVENEAKRLRETHGFN